MTLGSRRILLACFAAAMCSPAWGLEGELFPESGKGGGGASTGPARRAVRPEPKVVPPVPQTVVAPRRAASMPAPVPLAPVRKHAVPSASAIAAANGLLMEVFGRQIEGAKTPAQKGEVAGKLLTAAAEERDAGALYVLLTRARELGIEAGEAAIVRTALEQLEASFEPVDLKTGVEALLAVSKHARTGPQRAALVEASTAWAQRALAVESFEHAKALGDLGVATARLTGDDQLQRTAGALAETVRELEVALEDYKKGLAELAVKPDEAAAHLAVGKYLCAYKRDWGRGLEHLAKGSDKGLAALARADLAGGAAKTGVEERMKVADAWWEGAEGASGSVKKLMVARASMLYAAVQPELSGLAAAKVAKRLGSVDPAAAVGPMLKPGDGEIAFGLLARIPREMLPAREDSLDVLRKKTAEVHAWMADHPLIAPSGNKVTLHATLAGVSAYEVPVFTRPGAAPPADSKPHRITLRFTQQFDFRGTACRVWITANKSYATANDAELVRFKSLEGKPADTVFALDATITGMAVSFSRPFTVNEKNGKIERVPTGGPPTISVNLRVNYADFSAAAR